MRGRGSGEVSKAVKMYCFMRGKRERREIRADKVRLHLRFHMQFRFSFLLAKLNILPFIDKNDN